MTGIPAFLSKLGIAKEVTPLTAAVPTNFLRVENLKPKEKVLYLPDETLHASMAKTYGEVTGPQWAEYELDGPVFADEIGWVLAGLLNDLTVTGAADPFTTAYALLNTGDGQPTSYSLTDYNGNNARVYAGCKFSKLDLTFGADALFKYSAAATGASFATASNPTFSAGATAIIPNTVCTATVGGAAAAIVLDGSISIARTVKPVHSLNGSASPGSVFAGSDLTITGQATLAYDAAGETVLGDYLAGTVIALTFDWLQSVNREVKLQMSQANIDDATKNRSQGDLAQLAITFTGIANTTDAGAGGGFSPAKATTKNASTSGTYK